MRMIFGSLNRCNLSARELGAIAVSGGPGSYTGIANRGFQLPKEISICMGLPLISIPTWKLFSLCSLFQTLETLLMLFPVLDAKKDGSLMEGF